MQIFYGATRAIKCQSVGRTKKDLSDKVNETKQKACFCFTNLLKHFAIRSRILPILLRYEVRPCHDFLRDTRISSTICSLWNRRLHNSLVDPLHALFWDQPHHLDYLFNTLWNKHLHHCLVHPLPKKKRGQSKMLHTMDVGKRLASHPMVELHGLPPSTCKNIVCERHLLEEEEDPALTTLLELKCQDDQTNQLECGSRVLVRLIS